MRGHGGKIHLAIIAPPLPGHLNPLRALALELTRRGHRASLIGPPDAAPLWQGTGLDFVEIGRDLQPPGHWRHVVDRMARLRGPLGLRRTLQDVTEATTVLCRRAPAALRAIGAKAIIADQAEAAGVLLAAHMQLPCIATATALLLDREPGLPPPFVDWGYDASPRGWRRNAGGWRVADWLMRPLESSIEREAHRLGVAGDRVARARVPIATLAQGVAAIDFPRRLPPKRLIWCGRWREPEAQNTHQALQALGLPADARNLAFCSLGTLQGSRGALFKRIASAFAGGEFVPVIAHGGRLSARAAAALPGQPIVRAFVPQCAVLARSRVAVLHGGFNSVLDALAHGVPIVALPLAFEQPGTAARLRHAGLAEVIRPAWADAARIRAAIDRVCSPAHQAAAAQIAEQLAAAGGTATAADQLEAVLHRA